MMRHTSTLRRNLASWCLLCLVVTSIAIQSTAAPSSEASGKEQTSGFEELQSALKDHGTDLKVAPSDLSKRAKVSTGEAEAIARTLEGPAGQVSGIYLGVLTVTGQIDEQKQMDSGPAIERLVWTVQLTDLNLFPSRYTLLDPAPVHHELVVFIDAITGEPIMSQTAR